MLSKVKLRNIFNEQDPMGIFFGDNIDEYDPEIDIILKFQITKDSDIGELGIKIWEVFKSYFGDFEAGDKKKYIIISEKVIKSLK